MRKLLPLLLFVPALAAVDFSRAPEADIVAYYQQLRTVALDPSRAAVTENFVLKKDAAQFQFRSGKLYFFQPVAERVAGAVFIGDGVFTLQPPTAIERGHLARLLKGKTELEEHFSELVLLFSDGTFNQLSSQLKFHSEAPPQKAAAVLDDFRDSFREHLKINVEARLLAGLCFPGHGLFLAHFQGQQLGRLLFSVDPHQDEEIELIRYNNALDYFDTWASFRPAEAAAARHAAFVEPVRITVDSVIEKSKKISAESVTEFRALIDGPRMLRLHLAPTLRLSKAVWGGDGGRELRFIQEDKKKDADVWVILPEPLRAGQTATLRFSYAGDEVIHTMGEGNFFVGARTGWYPRLDQPSHALSARALYRLTFRTPKEYTLVATGRLLGRKEEGRVAVTEWDSEVPLTVAGFNYGRFKTVSRADGGLDISVLTNPGLVDDLAGLQASLDQSPELASELGITAGGLNTTRMSETALAETINSMRLFTHYFGPLPFKRLSVTQQPAGFFGQSWPMLVFMPYTAFLDGTMRNQLGLDRQRGMRQFLEEVGSHEVAHQWWGHLVGWETYHDQWLSEGFAQFSAGLYVQRVQGEKKFSGFLKQQREAILATPSGDTQPLNNNGPIWLGQRLSTEKHSSGYQLVYFKGGYVLHMLRMLLHDFARNDDSRFIAMMREFASTFQNRNASTEDFKAIVDRHFRADMRWFFDQWVYGIEVPKITVEYSLTDNEQGAMLAGTFRQRGVSPEFRVIMPVVLRFKAGGAVARISAAGAATPFQLQLRERPESVEFNPLDAVLCELEVKRL
jgi:hypothetical protein